MITPRCLRTGTLKRIKDLTVGESAWVMPDNLIRSKWGAPILRPTGSLFFEGIGSYQMFITRRGMNSFEVNMEKCPNHCWFTTEQNDDDLYFHVTKLVLPQQSKISPIFKVHKIKE